MMLKYLKIAIRYALSVLMSPYCSKGVHHWELCYAWGSSTNSEYSLWYPRTYYRCYYCGKVFNSDDGK